ncbi:TPA: hypothetical protein N0F65_008813 [Lagenidium giganteum]|uniref:Uncharacterized protein n=1 Tax=Lagenidium giganteum TaxID=4803 RepID=A0AAV2YVK1_9STRA|nr:TPA: hypothetical protein N0F65_008813 [Lagenidium giganteum]
MSWTTAGTSGNAGGGGGGASANAGGSGTAVTSSGVSTPQAQKKSSRAVENDLIVPVVLWNDVPRVKVSCVHVLYLPISQPSQNSSVQANGASGSSQQQQQMQMSISPPPQPPTPSSSSSVMPPRRLSLQDSGVEMRDSEGDGATKDGAECELYQVCVFAGTTDGAVVYWLYEQDQVVRVNLLVPNTAVCAATTTLSTADAPETIEDFSWDQYDPDQRNSPIVGITGGIDEWGQSIMLSVSRAGGVARWQLPNGYCSYTNAELASQLAPIKGIEMFSNNRYALVYSAESRMMVLDIWKMALLYCVDTAQEQIRRSIAVGEIKMNAVRRSGSFPKSLSSLPSSNSSRGPTDGVNDGNNGLNNGPGISGHTGSFGSQSSVNKNSGGSGSAPTPNTPGQVWDSLVISLGTEGLAKCFLWSRPRGGSNTAPGTSSTSSGTFTWMQESCWILSWADDAEDITCSQSTSLRDGDNMNPQTALMRSIKSSYFPIAVHVSPDSSLLLFIWKSKWVVLKRKWLCRTDNGNKTSNKSGSRTKTPVCVGSCRITPATFLGRKEDQRGVWWQGGEFIVDSQVVLWTNTGHVFQFPACGNAMNPAGKLFIFTKDLDQFVPRSNFKSLNAIEKGQYIAFLRQCECCSTGVTQGENGLRKRADRFHAGYTSCVTATGLKSTPLGPIQEIAVSPSSGDTSARSPYQDRFLASVGKDRKVIIYAPLYNHNPFSRTPSVYNMKNACGLEWECIYEFCEHPDTITGLDWHLENGFCLIECEDRMVHVWSLDTGLLERSVPSALVYEGGNSNADDPACTAKCSTVSWQKVQVGNTSIQLLKYAIMESAEHIKKSWRSYYYSLLAARNDEEESMEESEGKMASPYSKFLGDFSNDGAGAFSPSFPSSPNNKEEFHVLWSQLITQHSVVLPDYVPHFREPSLESLAAYGFHSCDYMQLAARALLNGVIKRLSAVNRSAMTAEYSTKLHCELVRLEMDTGSKLNGAGVGFAIDFHLVVRRLGSLVILLSMIGTCFPGEISPAGAREVCDILVYLLKSPTQSIASVSAELLTKGLMLFRPHLVDLSSLICQLLLIDMREKQRNPDGSSGGYGSNARVLANGGGSAAALSLLVELGACESAFVLNLLQQEMNNAERSHAFRECVLLYLTELINTHYLLMFRHLPAVIDTIMCCLDPTKPERRKRCLELSTRCLHNLVRRFPMVDFHKDTQRLAIGTMEAVILIYDLRTATKWRVLDGHTCAVSAVAFRSDGQIVVSYAAREGSVRWWNSGSAGIFGGMLKMQQSCLKEHKLPILKNDNIAIAPSSSGGASADLKQVIQTCRFQFLTVKDTQAQPGVEPPKEKRILRLTREDASQVQFLL